MNSIKSFLVLLVLGAVTAMALAIPAAAHQRSISQVQPSFPDDADFFYLHAWPNPDQAHSGVMKLTLKKRNASGDWVKVKTKTVDYAIGWGYFGDFKLVPGNKVCKGFAKWTAERHPTVRKASPPFDC